MPSFVDDPANLSKSRLKSDLVAHNVALPPGKSKKEVYVKLHLKHIGQKTAADFSSDEEDQAQDVEENKEENPAVPDLGDLTDDELKAALLKHGVKVGPIVASTRAVYERKLLKLLQPDGHGRLNGTEKDVRYSDSGEEDDAESDREEEKQTSKQSEQVLQEHSQPSLEPVADAFTELLPDTKTTPTGIYASRRRPIKGAAGRPVQYVYPDTPTSPTTLERREVARRLVPIHIQLLVFIIVACLLYLIYVCVEDNSLSPLTALLDSLMEGSDIEDGLLHQDKTQATTELFGQE